MSTVAIQKWSAVFEDMEKYQIDQFICLGDIIGYGDQPEKTIKLLMEKNRGLCQGQP